MNLCSAEEAAALASCFIEKKNCEVGVRQLCHDCATSGAQSQMSSPLIYDATNQPAELNVEGCVGQLAGDPSANGCGAKLAARYACGAQACTTCADDASKETCSTSAGTTVCATQEAAAQCATPFLAQCKQGTTETQIAYNLLAIFCGPP